MIVIGRSGNRILKNYWLNDQADEVDYARSVDVAVLSERRHPVCRVTCVHARSSGSPRCV